jgi:hypothetical protein
MLRRQHSALHNFKMIQEEKDWFRLKRYPHIGLPLKLRDRGWVESYVTNPTKIKSHSFFPFIHRKISVRKFRRAKIQNSKKSKLRVATYKEREVYYANHLDSNIYSYYSSILKDLYEEKLKESGAEKCVTAYRRIKLYENEKSRNKCNIDFANDIFGYIKSNNKKNLVSITFDITSFFDNLNHNKLKKAWCNVLNEKNLPEDHYAVFRNLTKFSFLELEDIFEEFKDEIIVKKDEIDTKRIKIDRIELLKNKDAIAFCEKKDFDLRIRKKNLIRKNKHTDKTGNVLREKGIPQGSPISSTLANIYLLQFDKIINEEIIKMGGIYRRYSDDMVVIVDEEYMPKIIELFNQHISDLELEIQPAKTQIFYFKEFDGKYGCKEYNLNTGLLNKNSKFEYLGFTFDGETVYLKSSGISKFYRKMKRSIKRGGFYAKYGKNEVPKLFKNRLYKRFSIIGAKRRTIFKKDPHSPIKWIKSNKYEWGNFLTYTELASRVFTKSNIKSKIKSQTKNHWPILHQLMKSQQDSIDLLYSKTTKPKDKK